MKRLRVLLLLISIQLSSLVYSQADHWEMAIAASDVWEYSVGNDAISDDWNNVDFDASSWNVGPGGVGYGNPDCNTTIASGSISVYVRHEFTVTDLEKLWYGQLEILYDDGFIAYLNGVEITRDNLSGTPPAWDKLSDDYQVSEEMALPFQIDSTLLRNTLIEGKNVLAVEVHNQSEGSSDLSCSPYLFFGIGSESSYYDLVPDWFIPIVSNSSGKTPATTYNLSSALPIIAINTARKNIVDEPKVEATMGIVFTPGVTNSSLQPYNHFDGKIGIELRGSSSLSFPKKSYGIELWTDDLRDTSVSVFTMPKEEDWILQGPYSDKSLLRNVLAYKMARETGQYAPRTQICELIINDEYLGVYVFMEKIKRDSGRVDIAKLKVDENTGEDLTGGYILAVDKPRGAAGFDSEYPAMGDYYSEQYPIRFLYEYPKAELISAQQKSYIRNYVWDFEDALAGNDFKDPNIGYRSYIDVKSFVDYMIVEEISKNIDGYRISTYLHKDKNGKLKMGPVWDFNFGFGMQKWYNSFDPEEWNYMMYNYWTWEDYQFPFWWERLLEDPYYSNALAIRWDELRKGVLSTDAMLNYIEEQVSLMGDAVDRNFDKWDLLGRDVDANKYAFDTYQEEVNYLSSWLEDRFIWLDANMPELIEDVQLEQFSEGVSIYPNPFTEQFSVSVDIESGSSIMIKMYDLSGACLGEYYQKYVLEERITIPGNQIMDQPSALSSGVYVLELISNNKKIYKRILKVE